MARSSPRSADTTMMVVRTRGDDKSASFDTGEMSAGAGRATERQALLERDGERGVIADVLGAAQRGSGAVVLVEAAAGLGKSALLDDTAAISGARSHAAAHACRPAPCARTEAVRAAAWAEVAEALKTFETSTGLVAAAEVMAVSGMRAG